MKIFTRLTLLLVLIITVVTLVPIRIHAQTPPPKSIKFGYFTPDPDQVNPSQTPKNKKNVECTEAWAQETVDRYEAKGIVSVIEKSSLGLIACDLYRYVHGCTDLTKDSCNAPCIYIKNGPTAEQIQSDPKVIENLQYFHTASTELFNKYWIYTKAVGRFDFRNGFGLKPEGRDEAMATLRAMSCRERAAEINHHVGTPLYFYPKQQTNITVSFPNGSSKSLFAYPDGTFLLNNTLYSSLGYDLSNISFTRPTQGRIINGQKLASELQTISRELKLNTREAEGFIAYWIDTLPQAPYYFVSQFEESDSSALANWKIEPAPDTQIRYMLYFKPLVSHPQNAQPLYTFSSQERKGFTVLDWGGVVDW